MIAVGIFIKNSNGTFDRVKLFDDEKISVNSSIQNVNDISKVFTDFSQTFTVPAEGNNHIFKHWYENSLDDQFSTLVKSDAYIELDTVLFRTGKIQLESCSIVDGQPQNYSITFIGLLGSLKDKFAGVFDYIAQKIKNIIETIAIFRIEASNLLKSIGLDKLSNFVMPDSNQLNTLNVKSQPLEQSIIRPQQFTAGGQLDVNIKGLPKGSNAGFTPRPNNFLPVGVNSVFAGI